MNGTSMLNIFKFSISDLLLGGKSLFNHLFAGSANLYIFSVFAIAFDMLMTLLLTSLFSLSSCGSFEGFSHLLLILALLAPQPPGQEPRNASEQEEQDEKK